MNKKGLAIGQVFIFIVAAITFALIMIFGYKAISGFISSGEEVEFVVKIESERLEELQDLKAVLVSQKLGLNQEMAFDSVKKVFILTTTMPEPQPEGFSADYRVLVSASLGEEEFSETVNAQLTLIPVKEIDTGQLAQNIWDLIGLPLLLLMAASTIAFVGWRWSLQRKVLGVKP